jgi:hypothetical protein
MFKFVILEGLNFTKKNGAIFSSKYMSSNICVKRGLKNTLRYTSA